MNVTGVIAEPGERTTEVEQSVLANGCLQRRRPDLIPDRGPARASAGDGEDAGVPCEAGAARRPGPAGVRPHRVAGPGRIRPRPRGSPGTTAGARRTTRRRPGPGTQHPGRLGVGQLGIWVRHDWSPPSPLPFRRLRTAPTSSLRRRRPERFTRQGKKYFLSFPAAGLNHSLLACRNSDIWPDGHWISTFSAA